MNNYSFDLEHKVRQYHIVEIMFAIQTINLPPVRVGCANILRKRSLNSVTGAFLVIMGKVTHGLSKSKTYSTWVGMLQRCKNKNCDGYRNYGGRGIRVCERWKKFSGFLEDMGEKPNGLSIERVNNDGDYEPGNCRWATLLEQARNKRKYPLSRCRVISYGGKTMHLTEWSRHVGVRRPTMIWRLRNWPLKRALTEKPNKDGVKQRETRKPWF
jgi:hypothetical protein